MRRPVAPPGLGAELPDREPPKPRPSAAQRKHRVGGRRPTDPRTPRGSPPARWRSPSSAIPPCASATTRRLRRRLRDAELLAERSPRRSRPTTRRSSGVRGLDSPMYRRKPSRSRPDRPVRGPPRRLPSALAPGMAAAANESIDEAIEQYRWHRRLAGDARKKNALLQFLYKGG